MRVAAFTVVAVTVGVVTEVVNVPVEPVCTALVLPMVLAFTVVAVTVGVVTEVEAVTVAPVIAAPVLPIVGE